MKNIYVVHIVYFFNFQSSSLPGQTRLASVDFWVSLPICKKMKSTHYDQLKINVAWLIVVFNF